MTSKVVRSVKNVTKGYTHVQVKVRNATSNDAWGPTGSDMSDIAQMTFSSSSDFYEIMDMLDKRLNDKGKNWRHVLKSLKVLDYCLHEGSELVVTWARKNIYIIKTLREFQYVDEESRDVGQNVRTSAKELTALILDEDRLRAERHDRKLWKTRVTGLDDFAAPSATYGMGSDPAAPRRRERKPAGGDDDDLEYRLALEASKNAAEEDQKRRSKTSMPAADDGDLARAIRLSKEEEDLRRRELEQSNATSLFDDLPTPTPQQPQATGWNQGYQQQSAVDWFGNPVEQQPQQQPQNTGYLNNMYSQPTGVQPQQTGFQGGYGYNAYQQPQQTGFNQSQYQPQLQSLEPQPTAFSMNNPYGAPGGAFDQGQQQSAPQSGSNNPWAFTESHSSLASQPTGSNNPFAPQSSSFARPPTQTQRAPTLNTLQEQKTAVHYNPTATSSFAAQAPPPQKDVDPHAARLNALLAAGEGQDTFGNVGNMRIPAQHTAPGTFVNSHATTLGRLQPMQTGTNPFLGSQYTGMPSQQQQPLMPAATGPGGFGGGGYGTGSAFGRQQQQQRPQGGGGGAGGSLIDL